MVFRAVLFDLGGVVITSPMAEFAAYERRAGLPDGFLRRLNATDPDTNPWARFERGEVDEARFVELFEAEARASGHQVDAHQVLATLAGEVHPEMVTALHRLRAAGIARAAVTNNVRPMDRERGVFADLLPIFDVVVESSVERVRKPEPGFYEIALRRLGGLEPADCVYLDDLGVNLKPARAMGMTTIKVVDTVPALRELGALLHLELAAPVGG